MGWTASFFPEGAELTYHGRTTGDDMIEAKRHVFANFGEGLRYILCDFTSVEIFDVSPAAVQQIIELDRAALDEHPDVLEAVVAPTPLEYGMSRMWQMRIDEVRPHTVVARSRAEAVDWLEARGVQPLPRAG